MIHTSVFVFTFVNGSTSLVGVVMGVGLGVTVGDCTGVGSFSEVLSSIPAAVEGASMKVMLSDG